MQCVPPGPVEPGEQDHGDSVAAAEGRSLDLAVDHDQLLSKESVLGVQLGPRSDGIVCRSGQRSRGGAPGTYRAHDGVLIERANPTTMSHTSATIFPSMMAAFS